MDNIRNYEPIWIHDTSKLLYEFIKRGNIDLRDSYNLVRTSKVLTNEDMAIRHHLYRTITTITYELLVLITENFNNNGFNLSEKSVRDFLRDMKNHLPEDMKNINATELLKSIRNSIAHNSDDIKNFDAASLFSYEISIKKKGVSTETTRTLSPVEIHQILEIYDKVRRTDIHQGGLQMADNCDSVDALLKARKKFGTFNRVIQPFDKNENTEILDHYQESALLRFLIKHKPTINSNFLFYISRFMPKKDNKFNHYENKYHLIEVLRSIISSYPGITNNGLIKFLKKEHPTAVPPFIDPDYMKSLTQSSIAFSIFSARTPANMNEIAKNAGIDIHEGILRHIRNSLVHGRYFYNFKDGFEIYDGTDTLSHITTLTFDQINKLYTEIFKDKRIDIINSRINYINSLITNNPEEISEK